MKIQPMRRVRSTVVTLSCGHRVKLGDKWSGRVLPSTVPCIDCDPVPEKHAHRFPDGVGLPRLRLVGGAS